MVDPTDAVSAAYAVERLDERHPLRFASVERNGNAALELDFQVFRLVGSLGRVGRPRKGLGGGFIPRVLQHARLAASAPEILVDTVGALDGRLNRDSVLGRVLERLG